MLKVLRILFVFMLGCMQVNCASIFSGNYQMVRIESEPAGAKVYLNDQEMGVTPFKKKMLRKERHTFVIKKQGFIDETRITKQGYNWWGLGNVVFGLFGLIGMAIDYHTGAGYTIDPNEINIQLLEGESSLGA